MLLPDAADAALFYGALPEGERSAGFWTKVWPSALSLSEYIISHPALIRDKRVWEIAAGLGVPSLFAAKTAGHVIGSDNSDVAVENMMESAKENNLTNFEALVWDFTKNSTRPACDVILISDANYDGNQNQPLSDLVIDELKNGRTVILSTPNRISGMGFLDPLLPFCVHKDVGETAGVFCLKNGKCNIFGEKS